MCPNFDGPMPCDKMARFDGSHALKNNLSTRLTPPFLKEIRFDWAPRAHSDYPFNIPCLRAKKKLTFKRPVTFLVGENGSGKSTLLESIAIFADSTCRGAIATI